MRINYKVHRDQAVRNSSIDIVSGAAVPAASNTRLVIL